MKDELGFDWKSLVGTIVSTIGTVATQFLGSSAEENMVLYNFSGREADDDSNSSGVFMKKNGKLVFFNNSIDENSIITLSFPQIGNSTPETITLGPTDYLEVEPYFSNAARQDTTQFMVSCCNNQNTDGQGFHIAASGSAIEVTEQPEEKRIGNYLTVKCYPDHAEFTALNRTMQQLSAVTIRGENDSKIRASRVPAEMVEGDYVATLNFPNKLPVGSSVEIDVEADMMNLSQVLEEQKKHYNILTMSEGELKEARERIRMFKAKG